MKRTLTAFAAASLLALTVPANAQSYSELRARAVCLDLGATAAGLDECVRSVRRREIMQGLGQALSNMGRQQQTPYAIPQHQWDMMRDAEQKRYDYNNQRRWE